MLAFSHWGKPKYSFEERVLGCTKSESGISRSKLLDFLPRGICFSRGERSLSPVLEFMRERYIRFYACICHAWSVGQSVWSTAKLLQPYYQPGPTLPKSRVWPDGRARQGVVRSSPITRQKASEGLKRSPRRIRKSSRTRWGVGCNK